MNHVPYKGAAPAVADLLPGRIQVWIGAANTLLPHIKDGKLKLLGSTAPQRFASLPDTPTIAEAGVPGYALDPWLGLFVPAKMPPDIVTRINAEVVKILGAPELKARLAPQGIELVTNSPARVRALHPRRQREMGQDHQGRRHQRRLNVATEFLRDVPVPVPEQKELWGSDAIAAMLRALDIPYLALNPGASYRGLHDSIVNYLGNERPQMLLCLHEESAVAIAHGYAKASGRMMGAVLHSNVGLMHGTMAIFNAWCDRVPMLILGATGPWDAAQRRPWIDWIHTASDQGALVRDYTKWDNQPGVGARRLRSAAARGADRARPRRAARPTSTSTPRCRKRRSARCRRCPTFRASDHRLPCFPSEESVEGSGAAALGREESRDARSGA